MVWLKHWLVGGLLLFSFSVDALDNRQSLASEFFLKSNKVFHVYVFSRELRLDDGVYKNQPIKINLAQNLYRQFSKRLEIKKSSVKPILIKKQTIDWSAADVVIVIRSMWVSTKRGYLPVQNNPDIQEIEVNYQLFIPSVYGKEPVADYAIRTTLPHTLFTDKSVTQIFADKLNQLYPWLRNYRVLNYLNGDITEQSFIEGHLFARTDDNVAAKLLALSAWNKTQTFLIRHGATKHAL